MILIPILTGELASSGLDHRPVDAWCRRLWSKRQSQKKRKRPFDELWNQSCAAVKSIAFSANLSLCAFKPSWKRVRMARRSDYRRMSHARWLLNGVERSADSDFEPRAR